MPWFVLALFSLNVLLAAVVLAVNPRRAVNRTGALFFLATASWNLCNVLIQLHRTLFIERVAYATGELMVVSCLGFLLYFCRTTVPRWIPIVLASIAVPLAAATTWTGLVIAEVKEDPPSFTHGALFLPMSIWLIGLVLVMVLELSSAHRRSAGIKRLQIRYLLAGSMCFAVVTSLGSVVLPLVGEYRGLTVGAPATLILSGTYCYVILRHRLFDIRRYLAGLSSIAPQLLEALNEGIWVIDRGGRTSFVNRHMADMLGYTPDELLGLPIQTFLTPQSLETATAISQRYETRREVTVRVVELVLLRRDGARLYTQVTPAPLYDEDGAYQGVIAGVTDVTERRLAEERRAKLEAKLQQAQRLESLGVLAGGIAHDFNNLLAVITGNVSLVLRDTAPESPHRESLEEIRDSSHRAAELTKQMLAYAGWGIHQAEPVELSSAVREMDELLRASVSKRCTVEFSLGQGLPLITVGRSHLQQVMLNLVVNASEAMEQDGGTITVSTGATECSAAYLAESVVGEDLKPGTYVFFEVKDLGCGIHPRVLERIFDPFFTTKFVGRGLGLAAVHGIVRAHGGAVRISSELGQGSVFRVLFPLARPPLSAQPPEPTPRPKGQTILVVDDEEQVGRMAQRILTGSGYAVRLARTGRECVDLVRGGGQIFDLVLLDLSMPGMDGVETFEDLRRVRPDLRVILSSGYGREQATSRLAGKGLDGFLQKPYPTEALLEAVARVLGDSPAIR